MKAIVISGPDDVALADLATPVLRPGQALCKVRYLGLCGVDLSLLHGYSTYIQQGLKHYPFTPGHEWSGTVVAVADDVDPSLVGRKVAGHNFVVCGTCSDCRSNRQEQCRNRSEIGILGDLPGAASELVAVPASVLAPLPDGMDLKTGVLLEPSSTAFHSLQVVDVSPIDRLLIVGAGTLGLCIALLARALGVTPTVTDVSPSGLELARSLGANAISPDAVAADAYDVIIEASGAASVIASIPGWIAPGGRVALVGVPNASTDGVDFAALVIKSVSIQGVLSGIHVWDQLISLVDAKRVDLNALIEEVFPLADFEAAYEALGSREKSRPKVLIEVTPADA